MTNHDVVAALPTELTPLERAVLSALLDRHVELGAPIAAQLAQATVGSREFSGVGFFTNFVFREGAPIQRDLGNAELTGVGAKHPQLPLGAGFILFIRDGVVSFLEGYTYDSPWPADESLFTVHSE